MRYKMPPWMPTDKEIRSCPYPLHLAYARLLVWRAEQRKIPQKQFSQQEGKTRRAM